MFQLSILFIVWDDDIGNISVVSVESFAIEFRVDSRNTIYLWFKVLRALKTLSLALRYPTLWGQEARNTDFMAMLKIPLPRMIIL